MMGNIYTAPSDYRVWPDASVNPRDFKNGTSNNNNVRHWVYNIPLNLRLASFGTSEEAEQFIQRRSQPERIVPVCYVDICRCGGGGPAWDYCSVTLKDERVLIFERCPRCKNPMRHDVMVELNRPFLENFSLDDFLNL
ncbi:hypothetical protein SEA_CASSEROLE_32 [Arthrobacter phage Casserole]|nr:hypothetical protein SEA_CASSEROLE_32 [Arthrobacter phage Casserole]